MAAWLDRHGLRPKFWNAENVQRFVVTNGDKYGEMGYERKERP
jgi:hypothetical protein